MRHNNQNKVKIATHSWTHFVFLLLLLASRRRSLSHYYTHPLPRRHLTSSPVVVTQISLFRPPAAESYHDQVGNGHQSAFRKRERLGTERSDDGKTYMSKYAIERASSPIDSSGSMMVLIRINNRRTDGSDMESPPLGRVRVAVDVSGRFVAHGEFGVGECNNTCRSIPAVAMSGSTGWMSVLLTIDRWPWGNRKLWTERKRYNQKRTRTTKTRERR